MAIKVVTSENKSLHDRDEMIKRGQLEKSNAQPNINTLKTAFDEAIAHHTSLPRGERVANSRNAREVVGQHVGRNKSGNPIDLLGKNKKLLKAEKGGENAITLEDGSGIETTGLSLSPAHEEGKFNTCPNSKSCKKECLGKTSGGYFFGGGGKDLDAIKGTRLNGYNKTQALLRNPKEFAVRLHDEIQAAKTMADVNGNHLGIRLNTLSDIHPKVFESLMKAHPDVTFYDYTKNNTKPIAPNHHLTYSSTGVTQPAGKNNVEEHIENEHQNWHSMRNKLDQGHNVAMAFSHGKELPSHVHDEETNTHYNVVSGDTHDFRPLDTQPKGSKGVIVGLTRKAATHKDRTAAKDSNGFFVHYDPQYKKDGTKQARDENGNPIAQNKIVSIAKQKRGQINVDNDGQKLGD